MVALKYMSLLGLTASVFALVPGFEKRAAIPDNSAAVLAALVKENDDVVVATKAVTAYKANDPNTTLGVFSTISAQVAQGVVADFVVISSPVPYSEAGAQAIIDYIRTTLEPNTFKETQQYEAKKAAFAQAGLTSFVVDGIALGRVTISNLASNLEDRMPADKLPAAQAVLDKLQQDLANLQASFEGKPQGGS